jgi:hypothetical protein
LGGLYAALEEDRERGRVQIPLHRRFSVGRAILDKETQVWAFWAWQHVGHKRDEMFGCLDPDWSGLSNAMQVDCNGFARLRRRLGPYLTGDRKWSFLKAPLPCKAEVCGSGMSARGVMALECAARPYIGIELPRRLVLKRDVNSHQRIRH